MRLVTLYSIPPGPHTSPEQVQRQTIDLDQPSSMRALHSLVGNGVVLAMPGAQSEDAPPCAGTIPLDHFIKCLMACVACVMIRHGTPVQQIEARAFLEKTLQGLKP